MERKPVDCENLRKPSDMVQKENSSHKIVKMHQQNKLLVHHIGLIPGLLGEKFDIEQVRNESQMHSGKSGIARNSNVLPRDV